TRFLRVILVRPARRRTTCFRTALPVRPYVYRVTVDTNAQPRPTTLRMCSMSRWNRRSSSSPSRFPLSPVRLLLEILEDRNLPNATPPTASLPPPGSYATDRIVVHYATDAPAINHEVQLKGISVADALAAYRADPNVQYAEPDFRLQTAVIP